MIVVKGFKTDGIGVIINVIPINNEEIIFFDIIRINKKKVFFIGSEMEIGEIFMTF